MIDSVPEDQTSTILQNSNAIGVTKQFHNFRRLCGTLGPLRSALSTILYIVVNTPPHIRCRRRQTAVGLHLAPKAADHYAGVCAECP